MIQTYRASGSRVAWVVGYLIVCRIFMVGDNKLCYKVCIRVNVFPIQHHHNISWLNFKGLGLTLLVTALHLTQPDILVQLDGVVRLSNFPRMSASFVSDFPISTLTVRIRLCSWFSLFVSMI